MTTAIKYNDIEFTDEQTKVCETVLALSHKEIIITGPAGSGKSLITSYIVNKLIDEDYEVEVISPTHKAGKIMRAYLNEGRGLLDEEIHTTTVSKYLGQQPTITAEGKQLFITNRFLQNTLSEKILIVDEISMLDDKDIKDIRKTLTGNCHVIYLGDAFQLPPIKSKDGEAPIFKLGIPTLNLTVVKRTTKTDLGMACTCIRAKKRTWFAAQFGWGKFAQWASEQPNVFLYSNKDTFKAALLDKVKDADLELNRDEVRVLSYTNKVADSYNTFLREEYQGVKSTVWEPGDYLIALKPFQRTFIKDGKKIKGILLNNNDEFKLLNKISDEVYTVSSYKDYPVRYETWLAQTEEGDPIEVNLLPFAEKERANYDYILEDLSKIAKAAQKNKHLSAKHKAAAKKAWTQFYKFQENFDQSKLSFSLTIHKSQGSSIDHVFLDIDFEVCNLEFAVKNIKRALLYTAVSRARQSLHIFISAAHLGPKAHYTL